jgi:hypothetical protein
MFTLISLSYGSYEAKSYAGRIHEYSMAFWPWLSPHIIFRGGGDVDTALKPRVLTKSAAEEGPNMSHAGPDPEALPSKLNNAIVRCCPCSPMENGVRLHV